MIFNSVTFLVFLIAAILLFWSLPRTPRLWMLFLARILSGYSRPVLVTHNGDGSRVIFIVEQTGKIKRATF